MFAISDFGFETELTDLGLVCSCKVPFKFLKKIRSREFFFSNVFRC